MVVMVMIDNDGYDKFFSMLRISQMYDIFPTLFVGIHSLPSFERYQSRFWYVQ